MGKEDLLNLIIKKSNEDLSIFQLVALENLHKAVVRIPSNESNEDLIDYSEIFSKV